MNCGPHRSVRLPPGLVPGLHYWGQRGANLQGSRARPGSPGPPWTRALLPSPKPKSSTASGPKGIASASSPRSEGSRQLGGWTEGWVWFHTCEALSPARGTFTATVNVVTVTNTAALRPPRALRQPPSAGCVSSGATMERDGVLLSELGARGAQRSRRGSQPGLLGLGTSQVSPTLSENHTVVLTVSIF